MVDWVGVAGLAVGVVGVGYGIWSDVKRKGVQKWVHMALVDLKPGIQGKNREEILAAINNMLESLQPPPKSRKPGCP